MENILTYILHSFLITVLGLLLVQMPRLLQFITPNVQPAYFGGISPLYALKFKYFCYICSLTKTFHL